MAAPVVYSLRERSKKYMGDQEQNGSTLIYRVMDPEVDENEAEIASIEHRCFKGLARVKLSALKFDRQGHRELSAQIVARLHKIFAIEGCLRLDNENFISAVITSDAFRNAVAESNLESQSLCQQDDGSIPFLGLASVDCLHGLHRVAAARSYLDENDQWWTVRLYSDDLSADASRKLIEGYANAQRFSDGEIFWKIRFYNRACDTRAEQKWWARLTETKRKDLKQLLKHNAFAHAFDNLLEMPGLWQPIKLGTLHRLLVLKCHEEMLNYLRHILAIWNRVLSGAPKSAVDGPTVRNLELLAPAVSAQDLKIVEDRMASKTAFPTISDQVTRDSIARNLADVSCLIPSLRTFFENLKYLEPCCGILKQLLQPKQKKTIRQAFFASYFRPAHLIIECAENDRSVQSPRSWSEDRWLGYQQLWLYAMRHFPEMTDFPPRKELKKDKPVKKESNPALWHLLGSLAVDLGFRTKNAVQFKRQDPDELLAAQFLRHAEVSPSTTDDQYIKPIARVLKNARHASRVGTTLPFIQTAYSGCCEPLDRRYGRPFEDSHLADQRLLFIPRIYGCAIVPGSNVTSFYVKRDLILNFLGSQEHDLASSTADFSIGQGVGESEYDDTGVDFESSPALPTAGANENTMQRLEELEATNQRLQVQVQSHALTADQLRQELDRSSTRLQEQESVHEQALDQLRALQSQNLDSDGLRQELDRSEAQLRQENAMHGQALAELQTKLAEARDDIVNKQREIQMLLAKVSGLEEEKRVLTEAKQDASGRAMEDDAERGDLCAQRDEALEGEQSARHDLRNTVQALEKVQRISMAENPDLLDRYGMVQNTVAQLDTGRPYTVRVMTAVNDLGHCSFDCHDCPADQVDSTEFIHFAQHWWSEATSPPASLIYIGRGSQLFHTGTQDDFIDALRGMRRCTIVKHEMRTAYEGRYQMPWTGRMRLTDGTALDYNSSEQMQVVLSKREMQIVPSKIVPSKIVPSKIVPSKIVPSKIVPSKRKILTAKEIVEPPKRTKVVQDRRKGYQRIQLPNPKLLTASTSTAASPPSQEYDLPGSELSRRVSPEGRVYEVDDGDVL